MEYSEVAGPAPGVTFGASSPSLGALTEARLLGNSPVPRCQVDRPTLASGLKREFNSFVIFVIGSAVTVQRSMSLAGE